MALLDIEERADEESAPAITSTVADLRRKGCGSLVVLARKRPLGVKADDDGDARGDEAISNSSYVPMR